MSVPGEKPDESIFGPSAAPVSTDPLDSDLKNTTNEVKNK